MTKTATRLGVNGTAVMAVPHHMAIKPGELNEYPVPSTGRLLYWRPMNLQMLRRQVIRKLESEGHRQPEPPELEVKIGRKATGYEPDYRDPNFLRAYSVWLELVSERMMMAVYAGLAAMQPFGDEERAELDAYKVSFADYLEFGTDERLDWFMQFVVGNDAELIFNIVTGRAQPTAEGIEQEKKDS